MTGCGPAASRAAAPARSAGRDALAVALALLAACARTPAPGRPGDAHGGAAGPGPATAGPALVATPAALRFETRGGTWPAPQVLAVERLGPGLAPVGARVTLADGTGWLRVTPAGAGEARSFLVQATPSGLRPGTYRGEIALSAEGEAAREVAVAVTLTALAASGARCPPGSTLAWRGGGGGAGGAEPPDFGSTFLGRYCAGCHHPARIGAARNGAPPTMNFDTLEAARRAPYTLDLAAAAGPAGTRAFMPPEAPEPTLAERTWLGEWIACGQP